MPAAATLFTLPCTADLLVSGGDTRIQLNPATGASIYGSRPWPDPELVALGSSTASVISAHGLAAAEALRETCQQQLLTQTPAEVYAQHTERLRAELLSLCSFTPADQVNAVLAASGTDLHLLAAQWLQPQRTLMITPNETGSGVPDAIKGQHFNARTASGHAVPIGAGVSSWQGELCTLSPRNADGSPRPAAELDAECIEQVNSAAAAGQRVLLILTDVSKTGLIVPSIETTIALKNRWPQLVEVLVDACQFRLAPATVRAYLAQQWLVAVTGSKFMGGPTFCGALLIPPAIATRYRQSLLSQGAQAYSNQADWPQNWLCAQNLPTHTNFGLLLRWQAALCEMQRIFAIPEAQIHAFLQHFGQAIRQALQQDQRFEILPSPVLNRSALGLLASWDTEQTIFPFLLYSADQHRPLCQTETEQVYRDLLKPPTGKNPRRFQLGQPVPCGERDGIAVSALRLCVSAPMVVAACQLGREDEVIEGALGALAKIHMALKYPAR